MGFLSGLREVYGFFIISFALYLGSSPWLLGWYYNHVSKRHKKIFPHNDHYILLLKKYVPILYMLHLFIYVHAWFNLFHECMFSLV